MPILRRVQWCLLVVFLLVESPRSLADAWRYPWQLGLAMPPVSLLYCPASWLAGRCGNGRCEWGETAQNCPYDCAVAPVKNWNTDVVCSKGAELIAVESPAQLQEVWRKAAKQHRKVRILGARHSDNALICSDDLLLDMSTYRGVDGLEVGHHGEAVVRVRGGTDLYTTMTWLYQRGLMLEGYAAAAYREGTVAGLIATSSHGGSLAFSANISDIVDELTLVTAAGELKTYSDGDGTSEEWQAARANLGLLGAVVSVRLKVRPYHNLSVAFDPYPEADLLSASLLAHPNDCAWSIYYWTPRLHHVERICANETDAAADPSIENTSLKLGTLTGDPSTDAVYLGGLAASACDLGSRCLVRQVAGSDALFKGYFTHLGPDGQRVAERHFIGLNHLVTTSASGELRTVAFRTYELTVPEPFIAPALAAIQAASEADPCGLFGDISIRFTPLTAHTLVGLSANGPGTGPYATSRYAMHLELNGYLAPGLSAEQERPANRFNDDLVRRLIDDFAARPHWGKGQSWVLRYGAAKGVYGVNLAKFAALVQAADPARLLVNPLADAILSPAAP